MNRIIPLLGLLSIALPLSTSAAPIQVTDSNGQLIGARQVVVGSMLLDVDFVDGSCASIFDGCDDSSDFFFSQDVVGNAITQVEIDAVNAASQALLDQVFVDSALGMFDSDPTLTFGCENPFQCSAMTPIGRATFLSVASVGRAKNRPVTSSDEIDGVDTFLPYDSTSDIASVWAVWKDSSVAVPEPSTISLLGTGLFAIILARRRLRLGNS